MVKGADIMLRRYELTNQEWEQIAFLLPPEKTEKLGLLSKDNRTSLMGWSGLHVVEPRGATFWNAMASEIRYTAASASGLMMDSLIIPSGCSALRPNFMNLHWMPQLSRPTNQQSARAKKGPNLSVTVTGGCIKSAIWQRNTFSN